LELVLCELVALPEVSKGGDGPLVINQYLERPRDVPLRFADLLAALSVSFTWQRNRSGARSIVPDSSRASYVGQPPTSFPPPPPRRALGTRRWVLGQEAMISVHQHLVSRFKQALANNLVIKE
jgi:hypothetical protein